MNQEFFVNNGEALPWKFLKGASEDGLRRIAATCESSYQDESSGRTIATFGKSGPAVAREISAYLDSISGKAKKRVSKKKAPKPEHEIEVKLIEAFSNISIEILAAPAVIRWGTDRLHFRRAIASGWKPKKLEELMQIYFANANDPYIFLKGDIKSFVSVLSRLSVLRNATQPQIKNKVAISERDIESNSA